LTDSDVMAMPIYMEPSVFAVNSHTTNQGRSLAGVPAAVNVVRNGCDRCSPRRRQVLGRLSVQGDVPPSDRSPHSLNLCHSPLVSDPEISDQLACQVPGRAAAASTRVQVHAESVKVPALFSDSSCYDVAALTPSVSGNPRALPKGDARAPRVRIGLIDLKFVDVRSAATSAWAPRGPSLPCTSEDVITHLAVARMTWSVISAYIRSVTSVASLMML
jgi:hypothetical protein